MTILIDPISNDKLQAQQAASTAASTTAPPSPSDGQHQYGYPEPAADESSPLLPPAYADRRRASDLEDGTSRAGSPVKCKSPNRRWGLIMLALVAGALATAGAVLFSQNARKGSPGSGEGSGEEWMFPPANDTRGRPLPNPNTLPDWSPAGRHEHDHPSYPGTPLHVQNTTFHLPLAASDPAFFLHAFGEDAVGSVTVVNKPAAKESIVDVEISVVYAGEDKLKERVRIWEVIDGKNRHGVDIMTPRAHGFGWRSRTDYLRFHVVLRVPVDAKALAFEGMTTTMSLRVEGDDGKHDPSYRSFDYTTRNSPIEFATLDAEAVKLTTTNAHIGMLDGAPLSVARIGLRAKTAALTTTNGKVNLSTALIEVGDLLSIKSTSGAVLGWAGELQPDKADTLDKLVIETTNAGIKGQWAAKEVKAKTTNGVIAASFSSVVRGLSLQTTNERLTASVELGQKPIDIVPISTKTTNGALELEILPAKGKVAALKIEASTSNQPLTVVAPDFAGSFELATSNAGVEVTGERVHVGDKGGSHARGDRHALSGGNGKGQLIARTANARLKVAF